MSQALEELTEWKVVAWIFFDSLKLDIFQKEGAALRYWAANAKRPLNEAPVSLA